MVRGALPDSVDTAESDSVSAEGRQSSILSQSVTLLFQVRIRLR